MQHAKRTHTNVAALSVIILYSCSLEIYIPGVTTGARNDLCLILRTMGVLLIFLIPVVIILNIAESRSFVLGAYLKATKYVH